MATPNSATDTTAQSALYGETTGGSAVYSAGHTHQASRSFFIIDKSRMVGEEDTVEGAKVVYLPQSEFNKVREPLHAPAHSASHRRATICAL